MDLKKIDRFRKLLKKEQERLHKQIENLEQSGARLAMADSIGELSVYDNHPADIGDELFERSKDIALIDNARTMLDNIERSLAEIANGTFGICDKCGREIQDERLEALPWAHLCITCQQQETKRDSAKRPIEEKVLATPFHRTFLDESDFVGFDGEDALQSVLRYGSSDSPQDIPGTKTYTDLFPNRDESPGIVDKADAIPAEEGHQHKSKEKAER